MSAVGFDAAGEILVDCEEDLGIVRYDPDAYAIELILQKKRN